MWPPPRSTLFPYTTLFRSSLLHRSMPLHRGTNQTRLVILLLLLLCDSSPTLLSTLLTLRYFALLFRCWCPKFTDAVCCGGPGGGGVPGPSNGALSSPCAVTSRS